MLSPSYRGALITSACFLFVFMGLVAGYYAGRMYKTMKGTQWKKVAFMTASIYPVVVCGICFVLNFFIWGKRSSGAVPFSTMVALLSMWFGIELPLVFLGYYFGYRKQVSLQPNFKFKIKILFLYSHMNTQYEQIKFHVKYQNKCGT